MNSLHTLTKKIQRMIHLANALYRLPKTISSSLITLQDQNTLLNKELNILKKHIYEIKQSSLPLRQLPSRLAHATVTKTELIQSFDENSFYSESLSRIENLCPQNFKQWEKLLYVNEDTYTSDPVGSCSIEGHKEALLFRHFISSYIAGPTLDIGCGPQPVPFYLHNYPVELISGIDPLDPISTHPFSFVKGFSEFLPWKKDSFDTVIAATSLDHVLVPDQCMSEIDRVLTPNGHFLAWVSFIESDSEYNPHDANLVPVDKFHLFHFSRSYFLKTISRHFSVIEELEVSPDSCFYALSKRSPG